MAIVTNHANRCEWCNGHRDTLPLGMCGLHYFSSELLTRLKALIYHCNQGTWSGYENRKRVQADIELAESLVTQIEKS